MKKAIYSLLAAAAVLCGCQANESLDVKAPSGKKMTLTASIPSSQTKVVYEEVLTNDGLSLKATWADKDTISVLSYGEDGVIIAIDDFVCEGAEGKTSATFTGVLSEEAVENAVVLTAVYPRMDFDARSNEAETINCNNTNSLLRIYSSDEHYTEEPSEMERLSKAAVLLGQVAETADDELSVVLEHQHALVKFEIEVGAEYAGKYVVYSNMMLEDDNEEELPTYGMKKYDVLTGEVEYEEDYPALHYDPTTHCTHVVDEDGILTFYVMLFPTDLLSGGDFFHMIYLSDDREIDLNEEETYEEMTMMIGISQIGKNVSIEAGKLYTISGWAIEM